jgi:hypothetical protein
LDLVRTILPRVYAAKARGLLLCALTAGAGYGYYSVAGPDDILPASANAVTLPPIVKAGPIASPMHVIPEASAAGAMEEAPPNRRKLVRELQTALGRARCYHGPITGKWTVASKDAMGAFLVTVNAQLPVDDPDPALLALVTSNLATTCVSEHPLYTGALSAPSRSASETTGRSPHDAAAIAQQSASVDAQAPRDERSMLERAWAPAGMLVPPKDMASNDTASAPAVVTPIAVSSADPVIERDAAEPNPPTVSIATHAAPAVVPPFHSPVAAVSDSMPPPGSGDAVSDGKPDIATPAPPPQKVAQRKSKSTKRRAPRHKDTSFGTSFDSIQRSLSSIFD